ncbi:MAG: hypothetical protein ACNA7W_07980 [Pseudomonadales bacterium]
MPVPERRKPSEPPNRIVRSSAGRRLGRTIVLGAIVVFLAILWLADQLGLDRDELLGYALTSLMLVGVLVVLAVAGAVLLRLLKRLFR